jgi:EpsI family protein
MKLPVIRLGVAGAIAAVLLAAAATAVALTPKLSFVDDVADLEQTIPRQFGDWTEVATPYIQVDLSTRRDGETTTDQPYDQTLMRAYRNSRGEVVLLALAYGERQRQEVKVHRPDLCYVSQGFRILDLRPTTFAKVRGTDAPFEGKRMLASSRGRMEAVSYWMRIGDLYSENAWETRGYLIKEGLAGRVPDGILVRASRPVASAAEADAAFPQLEAFLVDLAAAAPERSAWLLAR